MTEPVSYTRKATIRHEATVDVKAPITRAHMALLFQAALANDMPEDAAFYVYVPREQVEQWLRDADIQGADAPEKLVRVDLRAGVDARLQLAVTEAIPDPPP